MHRNMRVRLIREGKKVALSSEQFLFSFQILPEGGKQVSFSYIHMSAAVSMMVSCCNRMGLLASFCLLSSHAYAARL